MPPKKVTFGRHTHPHHRFLVSSAWLLSFLPPPFSNSASQVVPATPQNHCLVDLEPVMPMPVPMSMPKHLPFPMLQTRRPLILFLIPTHIAPHSLGSCFRNVGVKLHRFPFSTIELHGAPSSCLSCCQFHLILWHWLVVRATWTIYCSLKSNHQSTTGQQACVLLSGQSEQAERGPIGGQAVSSVSCQSVVGQSAGCNLSLSAARRHIIFVLSEPPSQIVPIPFVVIMWLVRVCRAVVALLAPLFGLQLSLGPGLYHLFLLLAEPQGLSGLNHRAYGQVELDRFKRHITYTIKEESEIGSFVGDLRIDSDIEQAVLTIGDSDGDGDGDGDSVGVGIGNRTLCFELYDDSTGGLFRLEFTSGQLFVARRIDREAICPGQAADQPELGHFSRLPDPVDQGNGNGNGNGEADGDSDVRRGGRDSVTAVCQLELTVFIAPSFWINVVVTVQDINDHEPRFPPTPASPSPSPSPSPSASALPSTGGRPDGVSSSVYTVRISEAVEPGYQVPLVGAIDEDIGANGIQTYRLHGDELTRDGMFELHFEPPYSLNLVVLGRLDTETTANYSGHLVACDAGLPVAKCGRQALLVLVTDVNDNKPVFAQPGYLVTVEESVAVGEVIARVSAVDADSGAFGQLTYHLGRTAEPGVTQHFAVRLDTGEVVVKAALNARRLPKASLPIVARDAGPIPLLGQTVLRVEVRDVNDHRPWIQVRPILPLTTGETTPLASTLASASASSSVAGRVTMSIVENRPAGSGVGLVISGDEDVGRNSEVTCRLTTGQRVFRLEHSNEAKGRQIYTLVTATRLDREAAPANGLLGVGIRCTDRGLPTPLATEEAFEVALLDEDEFAPQFEAGLGEPVTVRVEENLPAGSPVVRLTASDADATARLVYSLSTEAQAFFSVDPATGQVVTRLRLDREAQPDIDFMLLASDAVGPMATATATAKSTATARVRVRVLVTDVNDNA
ncbi:unnamed protein product, partial [Protopolystoma xenopodis]